MSDQLTPEAYLARITELEEALKPLAALADTADQAICGNVPPMRGTFEVFVRVPGEPGSGVREWFFGRMYGLTYAHAHAARLAIAKEARP